MKMHPETQIITDVDDPRIAPYVAMKDGDLARGGVRFIAEGEHVTRRLLASGYRAESVLLSERRAAELIPHVPAGVQIFIAPKEVLNQIVGFKFHSGVLGCGLRGPTLTLDQLIPKSRERLRIVICQDINNTENLGSIIRIAAAFGVDLLLLGERCADPFFRRCIRVSMGAIFQLPIMQSQNLLADLQRLREEWHVELSATVLRADAQPLLAATRSPRMGLLLGGEAQGLTDAEISICDRRITIPMHLGIDSLNVAVAAGIFLYHFCA